jgi:hypothetical protein
MISELHPFRLLLGTHVATCCCCFSFLWFCVVLLLCLSDLKSVYLSHQESSLTLIQADLNYKNGEKTLYVTMKICILGLFHQTELGLSAECGREHRTCSCNQTLVLKVCFKLFEKLVLVLVTSLQRFG